MAKRDGYWRETVQYHEALKRYPDQVVDELAAELPRFADENARVAFPERIRDWAAFILLGRQTTSATPKQTRDALRELSAQLGDAAKKLHALPKNARYALIKVCMPPSSLWPLVEAHTSPQEDLPEEVRSMVIAMNYVGELGLALERLDTVARRARYDVRVPRTRPRDVELRSALDDLAHIYMQSSGQRPTIINDGQRRRGPWPSFARRAIKPLWRDTSTIDGHLDAVCRKVATESTQQAV